MVKAGSHITIVTDASVVASGIFRRRCGGDNWDLWWWRWEFVRRKTELVVCKIRSHQLDLMGKLANESTPVWWCVGNLFADALADRGRVLGALPAAEVTRVRQVLDVVCKVQKRLVALGLHMVRHGLPRTPADGSGGMVEVASLCPPTSSLVVIDDAILQSEHSVTKARSALWCSRCCTGVSLMKGNGTP